MTRPLICATVIEASIADLVSRRDAAAGDADMVELRLDGLARPEVAGALRGRTCPVVVTCRPEREGGRFRGSEDERHRVLADAIDSDADWVDLEWSAGLTSLIAGRQGRGVVLSMHDFGGIPDDLEGRVGAMLATGAEVVKVAVTPHRLGDCVRLLGLRSTFPGARIIVLGMGEAGLSTRVMAAKFGSPWTYAGDGVAPGQVPIADLRTEFRFDRISESTALYGVVGGPARHSVSPAMHNAGFAALGVDAAYLPFPTSDLEDFVRFARGMGVSGVSVTIPFKVSMMARLDHADDEVRRVGAVNTIAMRDGRWFGTNTDVDGFLEPLVGETLAGARATILGNGGAARAVAIALRSRGADVVLAGRDQSRAGLVAAELGVRSTPRPIAPGSWDLLVNATPVGMVPRIDESPFVDGRFDGRLVYDLVYNPPQTAFMRAGAAAGCRVIGGLDMLVAQARRQAAWWTGRAPDAEVLRRAAEWRLARLPRSS
jgi:3-dehydroquinate dehydratase/shikimate dehydrogenase